MPIENVPAPNPVPLTDSVYTEVPTKDATTGEQLSDVILQLKIMNKYMAALTGAEFTVDDLDGEV